MKLGSGACGPNSRRELNPANASPPRRSSYYSQEKDTRRVRNHKTYLPCEGQGSKMHRGDRPKATGPGEEKPHTLVPQSRQDKCKLDVVSKETHHPAITSSLKQIPNLTWHFQRNAAPSSPPASHDSPPVSPFPPPAHNHLHPQLRILSINSLIHFPFTHYPGSLFPEQKHQHHLELVRNADLRTPQQSF